MTCASISFSDIKWGMNRLRDIRKNAGLTLKQVAEAFEVTPMTIQRFEKGTRNVSLKWLEKLAELYKVSVPELIAEGVTIAAETSPSDTGMDAGLLEEIVAYALGRCAGRNVDPHILTKVIVTTYARCRQSAGGKKTTQIHEKVDDMLTVVAH